MNVSDAVLEKAARLVDENRVVLSRRVTNCAVVCGDTGTYHVWAHEDGLTCECWTGAGEAACSHVVAAMVAFYERDSTTPFGPPTRVEAPPFTGFAGLRKTAV